jgi:hypothetical protein
MATSRFFLQHQYAARLHHYIYAHTTRPSLKNIRHLVASYQGDVARYTSAATATASPGEATAAAETAKPVSSQSTSTSTSAKSKFTSSKSSTPKAADDKTETIASNKFLEMYGRKVESYTEKKSSSSDDETDEPTWVTTADKAISSAASSSAKSTKSTSSNSAQKDTQTSSSSTQKTSSFKEFVVKSSAASKKGFPTFRSSDSKFSSFKSSNAVRPLEYTPNFKVEHPTAKRGIFHSKHYMPVPGEVLETLERHRITYKVGTTSLEVLIRCPQCMKRQKTFSRSVTSYSPIYTARLDRLSGAYNCNGCNTSTNWVGFLHLIEAPEVKGINNIVRGMSETTDEEINLPAERFVKALVDVQHNEDAYALCTGHEEGQMQIQDHILQLYGVKAGYLSPEMLRQSTSKSAKRSSNVHDGNEPNPDDLHIVFPRVGICPPDRKDIPILSPLNLPPTEEAEQSNQETTDSLSNKTAKPNAINATSQSTAPPSLILTRYKAVKMQDTSQFVFEPLHNAIAGLFGYQLAVESKSPAVVITGREFEAMAVYQCTRIPAVSLPDSQYQLPLHILPLLESFDRVYIWLDDDVHGRAASAKLARKLGLGRCFIVNGDHLNTQRRPLNAWEAMVNGHDLNDMIRHARIDEHHQVISFSRLRDLVLQEVLHPEQTRGTASKILPLYNKILKGHRPGELTIMTGPTGAGKTTVISHLSLDFCSSGMGTLWGSFEIANIRLAKKMLYQFSAQDLSKNPDEFDHWADKFEQVCLLHELLVCIN